jgi:arylsulfatase A-like enzyme
MASIRALDYLRDERDDDKPFFLFVGLTGTHPAYYDKPAPARLVEQYRGSEFADIPDDPTYRFGDRTVCPEDPDNALANYYAAVQGVDEQVGRLVDELSSQGHLDETLVLYTADHGNNCGHHGLWKKGNSTAPLNMVEESIRVPLLVAGHHDLEPFQRRPEFVDHTDTFQTLLDFAGADRADANCPGTSYLPQLVDAAGSTDRDQVQICEHRDVRMIRTEQHKLVRQYPDGMTLLFDLDEDPRETRNRADDPAYEPVREDLTRRLEAEFEQYSRPEHSGVPSENIAPTGSLDGPLWPPEE